MVEKKVKKIDPEYYSSQAVEKKFSPLFVGAKTRKSKDLNTAEDCKQIIIKKESKKFGFAEFDAPKEEY